tara:strand:- start:494 stop:892 length:399 start_codon:yes stop_codon:yes gene_type:complete
MKVLEKPFDNPKLYKLVIKKSPIHGRGVFTKIDRKKDELIVSYNYKPENVMKWLDFKKKYGNDFEYTYCNRRKWKVISVKDNRNICTFLNDDRPHENVYLKNYALYAKVNIKGGEELTLRYPHYDPRIEGGK